MSSQLGPHCFSCHVAQDLGQRPLMVCVTEVRDQPEADATYALIPFSAAANLHMQMTLTHHVSSMWCLMGMAVQHAPKRQGQHLAIKLVSCNIHFVFMYFQFRKQQASKVCMTERLDNQHDTFEVSIVTAASRWAVGCSRQTSSVEQTRPGPCIVCWTRIPGRQKPPATGGGAQ